MQPAEGNRFISTAIAAFSTLDEALYWLRQNMARPANDVKFAA